MLEEKAMEVEVKTVAVVKATVEELMVDRETS